MEKREKDSECDLGYGFGWEKNAEVGWGCVMSLGFRFRVLGFVVEVLGFVVEVSCKRSRGLGLLESKYTICKCKRTWKRKWTLGLDRCS